MATSDFVSLGTDWEPFRYYRASTFYYCGAAGMVIDPDLVMDEGL